MTLDFVQGVEMDWEWPIDTGDKKDKIKLIRYMRVSRLGCRLQLRKLCSPAGRGVMPAWWSLDRPDAGMPPSINWFPGLNQTQS